MTHRTYPISRRDFLAQTVAAGAAFTAMYPTASTAAADSQPSRATNADCDVLVYGATPGGIAAAVAAARLGRRVVLADHQDHIGGIVSNGLTNADIHKKQAVGGLFYEFTRRVVRHYERQNAVNVRLCRNGYFYQASAAEQIFHEMLAEEAPRIELRLASELVAASVESGRLVAVTLQDIASSGDRIRFTARAFIDATYEGDLAAAAGAPYRVGRESRNEYGEPHAGRVYTHFGQSDLLPGSTGEADDAIQAFCFRFHVTDDPAKRVPIERPQAFRRTDYRYLLDDLRQGKMDRFEEIIQVYPMPNGRFELNSNHCHPTKGVPTQSLDLAEENFSWPEASPAARRKIYQRYLSHNVGMLWLLANDPEVPARIREGARRFGWHRDEWADNGHVPRQVYVRQGRRILGDYILTERDGELDPQLGRTKVQCDSIGVVEFAFDSHACHKYDPAQPGVREGYIYIEHEPLQVPYGVLVPREIEGLLVPVACSASHVGYNAVRMEPVFMALGEASGIAADVAIRRGTTLRQVPTAELQKLIVERGGVITFYSDLPADDPAFAAFQWLGGRGLNPGYRADADKTLRRADAATRLHRVLQAESKAWSPPSQDTDAPLRTAELSAWLGQAGVEVDESLTSAAEDRPLKAREFAILLYGALAPR